jgi:hypothetical protein
MHRLVFFLLNRLLLVVLTSALSILAGHAANTNAANTNAANTNAANTNGTNTNDTNNNTDDLTLSSGYNANAATTNVNNTASFWQTNYNGFYLPSDHLMNEIVRATHEQEAGSDPTQQYVPTDKPGTVSSGRDPELTVTPPATKAQQLNPTNQNQTFPFIQKMFTEYPNPLLNNFGPPVSGAPFRFTLPSNPTPTNLPPNSFKDAPTMTGAPPSDLVTQEISYTAHQREAQELLNTKWQSAQAGYQGTMQMMGDGTGAAASGAFNTNITNASQPLINVANENAGSAGGGSIAHAVWIVQQMYRTLFFPLAILLLLVGSVVSQSVVLVRHGLLQVHEGDDSPLPFSGLIKTFIAFFLMIGVQLIISWSIDIGNSMTDVVNSYINVQAVSQWGDQIANPNGGLTQQQLDQKNGDETTMAATGRAAFGSVEMGLNYAMTVLMAFQVVMVCYLFLMGPVAAAFFAWPGNIGSLFKTVFSSWVNGVCNVVMWRFWWCLIILCMGTRIQWLQQIGDYNPNGPFEPYVYMAFMCMLAYVPFAPFEFRPGALVDSLMQKAQANGAGGGS